MAEAPHEIGRRTVFAAAWAFVSATGKRFLSMIGLTLLARVLNPHDFGLMGFALVYLTFIEVIGDFSVGVALVYWPERRDDAAQVSFVANVAMGLFWCLFSLALAPLIAHFFHAPHGTAVLRVLSVTTLIKFLGNTHDALLQKDLRFRDRTGPELAVSGVKAALALVLAWLGFGAWSLVWGHIAGLVAWTVLLWVVVDWRPSFRLPRDLFRPMLRYGVGIVGVRLLSVIMFDIDVVVVGRFLGVAALGMYEMAARVPDSTVMVLIWVINGSLFPVLTKLHAEGSDVRAAYLVATRCSSSLTFPASVALFLLARPVIVVFFGNKWAPGAPVMSMLALYVGLRSIDYDISNVLKATGRTGALFWLMASKVGLIVPAVILAGRMSAVAVAGALAGSYLVAMLVTIVLAARVIGIPLLATFGAFRRSGTASAAMALVIFASQRLTGALPPAVQLAAGVLLGGATYVVALRLLDPQIFEWMRAALLKKQPGATDELLRHASAT